MVSTVMNACLILGLAANTLAVPSAEVVSADHTCSADDTECVETKASSVFQSRKEHSLLNKTWLDGDDEGECFSLEVAGTGDSHILCTPRGQPRHELLLYFPGSKMSPTLPGFLDFFHHAQGLGFHVFGLLYPNSPSMGSTCKSAEEECFEQERLARLYGGMKWDGDIIQPQDGGASRFEVALYELASSRPLEGWDAFLDPGEEGGVQWNRIVTAGNSQGAGMALLVAKMHALGGVVMLSGVNDVTGGEDNAAPAAWITRPGATDPKLLFGMGHRYGFGCYTWSINWPALGMSSWGNAADPHGQMLCSHAPNCGRNGRGINYHGCGFADPAYHKNAWTYMLLRGEGFTVEGGASDTSCCAQEPEPPPKKQKKVTPSKRSRRSRR